MKTIVSIVLCNLTVPHVSAYKITILTFVGQVFTGIVFDVMNGQGYQTKNFYGGLVIVSGIALNYLLEHIAHVKAEEKKAY